MGDEREGLEDECDELVLVGWFKHAETITKVIIMARSLMVFIKTPRESIDVTN